ncbi:hypothetical protein NADFUDRAFT_53259 [Nadsonia fulvescens var. elongata DSM 6958]|uniref:Nucleolar pre-ribosomal-associated protein 1 n=1 Tax=Nadsonia fulvescens var. elongata DSM 6958 TaxID=857566 RepID=A0A1E3PDW8_9ASCO|nr:hypothetical protein NADFUDRAFT_53259 [Nadsonia fulvescens var. elongata DSM 6958]
MSKRQRSQVDEVDNGLIDQLYTIFTEVERTNEPTALVTFLDKGHGAQVLQAWSYYSQTSNHSKLSHSTSGVSKLIKICSYHSVLHNHGSTLIRSILESHIKIIYRCLFINRPAVTNPGIRLLSEICKFQNGRMTGELFSVFDFTLKVLPKLLTPKKDDEVTENTSAPKIRNTFIRFIHAFMKNGSSVIRKDLITQRKIITGWFKYLTADSAELIRDSFVILTDCVLKETNFMRATKVSFFNDWVLGQIARLFYRVDATEAGEVVGDLTFNFMKFLCTDSSNGVCFSDKGWYEASVSANTDGPQKARGYKIHNRLLLSCLLILRPWDDEHQLNLVLEILASSPELVAPYMKSDTMTGSFDPKLTSYWVSHTVLFSRIISLPIPANVENIVNTAAPPVGNVLENILPSPLSKTALTKCLAHESPLIRFFGVQVLLLVFKKLNAVFELYDSKSWTDDKIEVLEGVYKRLPELQTIFSSLNSCPNDNELLRTTLVQLIAVFTKYAPDMISTTSVVLPGSLVSSLEKVDILGIEVLELQGTLEIQARFIGSGKWWNKTADTPYSLFTSLLRLCTVIGDKANFVTQISELLINLSFSTMLFQQESIISPIYALLQSLSSVIDPSKVDQEQQDKIWKLIDETIARCMRSPYKYLDEYSSIRSKLDKPDGHFLSPFVVTLIEQFKFVDRTTPFETVELWLCTFIRDVCILGESWDIVNKITSDAKINGEFSTLFTVHNPESISSWNKVLAEKVDIDKIYFEFILSASNHHLQSKHQAALYPMSTYDLVATRFRILSSQSESSSVLDFLFDKIEKSIIFSNKNTKISLIKAVTSSSFWIEFFKKENRDILSRYLKLVESVFESKFSPELESLQTELNNQATSECTEQTAEIIKSSLWCLNDEQLLKIIDTPVKYLVGAATGVLSLRNIILTAKQVEKIVLMGSSDNVYKPLSLLVSKIDFESSIDVLENIINYLVGLPLLQLNQNLFLSNLITSSSAAKTLIMGKIDSLLTTGSDGLIISLASSIFKHVNSEDEKRNELLTDAAKRSYTIIIEDSDSALNTIAMDLLQNTTQYLENEQLAKLVEHLFSLSGLDSLNPSVTKIIGSASLASSSENIEAGIKKWLQKCFSWLTRRLSEDVQLNERTKDMIKALTDMFNIGISVWKYVPRTAINAMLEASSGKWISDEDIINLNLSIVKHATKTNLEYTKLFQIIINHAKNPLLYIRGYLPASLCFSMAKLISLLFHFDIQAHSNRSVQTKLLLLYSGTTRADDVTLRYVLEVVESKMTGGAVSWTNAVFSWNFGETEDDETDRRMFIETRDGFEVCISTRLLARSIKFFDPSFDKEKVTELNEDSAVFYDPNFILMVIASSNLFSATLQEDGSYIYNADIKAIVDTHALDYVIVCLSSLNKNVNSMALRILQAIASGFETSSYRDRALLRLFINKILASVMAPEATTPLLPTITATILGHLPTLLASPAHFLHPHIASFILAGPTLPRNNIPFYPALLNSTEADHVRCVSWIIEVMTYGIKTLDDIRICTRAGVWETILGLIHVPGDVYGTKVSKNPSINKRRFKDVKTLIWEFIWTAQSVANGTPTLVTRNGAIAWCEQNSTTGDNNKAKFTAARFVATSGESSTGDNDGKLAKWMNGDIEGMLERIAQFD